MLLGNDQFNNSTLAMAGELRVRGPLEVSGLHLDDTVSLVNAATVTQTSEIVFGSPVEPDDDLVTIRNLAGATWDMTTDGGMSLIGGAANLVNLGVLEKTGGTTLSVIQANVRSLGTVDVMAAELDFGGPNSRFFGDIEGSGKRFVYQQPSSPGMG